MPIFIKKHFPILLGLAIFLISLIIYISALSPTIHPRDNPDIVTAAATLGIPHPPGYPLFTVLGYLFSKIPLYSIPWRVNLMSAIFSAAAVFVVYLIILKMTKKTLAALAGAAILAFSYSYFLQSLYADVLSLNNLLVALAIYVLLCWREKKERKYLYLLAFLAGLAFSHHQISLMIMPAIIYLLYTLDKNIFLDWKLLLKMAGFGVLGLFPFIYLPIRAWQNPVHIWGEPDTLAGFFNLITRKEFLGNDFSNLLYFAWRVFDWFKLITWQEFLLFGFVLGILGIIFYWKRDKKLAIFILLLIILSGPAVALLADINSEWVEAVGMERLFIFSYLIFSLAIGLGISWILEKSSKWAYLFMLILIGFLILNYSKVNLSNYYYAYDLGNNILKSLPANTVLFAGSDVPLFELIYLQKVEGKRPDVQILPGADPKLVNLPPSTKRRIQKEFPDWQLPIEELAKKYPLYTTNNLDIFWGPQTKNFIPEGIVYRYSENSNWYQNFDNFSDLKALENLKNYTYRGEYKIAKVPEKFTHEIIYYYINGWTSLGEAYQKAKLPADASFCYEKALEMDPTYLIALNNYAVTFLERGQYQEAIEKFKFILQKYPGLQSARNGLIKAQEKLSEEKLNLQ